MLHQAIRLRDIPENTKWKVLNDPDTMLVHVVLPRAEEVAAPAEGEAAAAAPAAAAEPEVIKKGKTAAEGEGEEKEKDKKEKK